MSIEAFAVRLGLFIAVTLYAWFVIELLERWRTRKASESTDLRTDLALMKACMSHAGQQTRMMAD